MKTGRMNFCDEQSEVLDREAGRGWTLDDRLVDELEDLREINTIYETFEMSGSRPLVSDRFSERIDDDSPISLRFRSSGRWSPVSRQRVTPFVRPFFRNGDRFHRLFDSSITFISSLPSSRTVK